MMTHSIKLSFVLVAATCIQLVLGHSQLMCAKYDTTTQECVGALPRNANWTYVSESYVYTGEDICQFPWVNPITSYYGGGSGCPDWAPCPVPMGTFTPGEQFTIMWFARNHDEADETPGNVFLYMSPQESMNQGSDVSMATIQETLVCSGPFSNCEGANGNLVHCSLQCTFPSVAAGYYTLMWSWPWANNGLDYHTCVDILVTSGSGSGSGSTTGTTGSSGSKSTTSTSSSAHASTTAKLSTGKITTAKASAAKLTTSKTTTAKITSAKPTSAKLTTAQVATTPEIISTGSLSTGAPSVTPTPPSTDTCTNRDMQCLTSETYSTCSSGVWGPSQQCQVGLTCHETGNVIYCY